MSDEPPTPPQELSTDVVDTLDGFSPEHLRHVAKYAEELAEYREQETRRAEDEAQEELDARPADLPDDVPSKAALTVKEINDNRYYYWQWREGDKVKSKYHAPVNGGS